MTTVKRETKEQINYAEKWSKEKIARFRREFLKWYDKEKRSLPWRENTEPYCVWISEIMLQQTRVDTVIPYYLRFLEWFPTIEILAAAPEDKLLKAWEGLGYYSRVRNIQSAAQQIVNTHQGKMPNKVKEISELKGIGPYTTGAIASISFGLPEPAIDGNVMRVISRLFCIQADIAKPSSRKYFDETMRQIIDPEHPGDFNQALMDLGSAICKPKNPDCEICPIQAYCDSYLNQTVLQYPVKNKKIKVKDVYYVALAVRNTSGAFLVEKRKSQGLLADMWTFPLIEVEKKQFQVLQKNSQEQKNDEELPHLVQINLFSEKESLNNQVADATETYQLVEIEHLLNQASEEKENLHYLNKSIWQKQPYGEIKHIFSHLKWHILLFGGYTKEEGFSLETRQEFVLPKNFSNYTFPKPQQKMVDLLFKER